jgi:uncharacterized protein (TIGR00251 family)
MPATLKVRVVPRASKTGFAGRSGDAVRVRLTAPPVEGAANAALVDFMAGALGVRRSEVTIVSGDKGREKMLAFSSLDAGELADRVARALGETA